MTLNERFIFAAVTVLAILSSGGAWSQAGFPYCEPFQSSLLRQHTVLGGSARTTGQVLQLTSATQNQNGYVYIDIPFSSAFGVKASFEYFSYGGTGADGLSFFLFDANIGVFRPGAFGGSLGYAQGTAVPGLTGAYIGVGFDSWGNFGNQIEGKNGGFPGGFDQLHPNSVVVRGPANVGYPFVAGIKVAEGGTSGLPQEDRFPISSGNTRVTNPEVPGYRKVFLDLKPAANGSGFLLSVDMEVTTITGNPRMVSLFSDFPYPYPPPANLKIGFSASTGGYTNIHEIRNLQVEVSADEQLSSPSGVDLDGFLACAGQEATYQIPTTDLILPNENSNIQCIRIFERWEDIEAAGENSCEEGSCGSENTTLVFREGTLQVDRTGNGLTFAASDGSEGERVAFFYTITDNYGMTSIGNRFEIAIEITPEPISLLVADVPVDIWRICPGEEVNLSAVGMQEYAYFEWYRNGNLLAETVEGEYAITSSGEYEVWGYNEQGCPAKSGTLTVEQPPLPPLAIQSPVVACHPDEVVDVRLSIEDLDITLFDYKVITPDGDELVNDDMVTRYVAGEYFVAIKDKEAECWSEPLQFRIRVVPEPVEAKFDYGINGSDRKTDEEGIVLTIDPIWFRDQSTGPVSSWHWDFGDSTSSAQRNPIHTYNAKGDFLVTLTVRSEGECTSVFQMEISIQRSYRIMVPTGFTPTRSENTHFSPKTKGVAKMELLVFSGWGELLFRSEDLDAPGWDGMVSGKEAPPGTYVYRINLVADDGEEVARSGKFLLVR